jgi:hypothetical protein
VADLSHLEWHAERKVVTIQGNIPVAVAVNVDRLKMSVEETGELLGLARRKSEQIAPG